MEAQASGKKPTGLFDLPAEIRIGIYELVLIEEDTVCITCSSKPRRVIRTEGLEFWAVSDLYDIVLPPLARVSRRLRSESLPVYFDNNTFMFEAPRNPAGYGRSVRIANFATFSQFAKRIEMRKFVSEFRSMNFTLEFDSEASSPELRFDSSQWDDLSGPAEKLEQLEFFAAQIQKTIERFSSTPSSMDIVKKDIVLHLLRTEFITTGLQNLQWIV